MVFFEAALAPSVFLAQFRVLVIAYKALHGLGPGYLKDTLLPYELLRLYSVFHDLLREFRIPLGIQDGSAFVAACQL